jgi:hypothetical protein
MCALLLSQKKAIVKKKLFAKIIEKALAKIRKVKLGLGFYKKGTEQHIKSKWEIFNRVNNEFAGNFGRVSNIFFGAKTISRTRRNLAEMDISFPTLAVEYRYKNYQKSSNNQRFAFI